MTAHSRRRKRLLNGESVVLQLPKQARLCKASQALHELWRLVIRPIAGETHRRLEAKAAKESATGECFERALGGTEQKKNVQEHRKIRCVCISLIESAAIAAKEPSNTPWRRDDSWWLFC